MYSGPIKMDYGPAAEKNCSFCVRVMHTIEEGTRLNPGCHTLPDYDCPLTCLALKPTLYFFS